MTDKQIIIDSIDYMKPLRVLSLFDGISCGQVALERAGVPVEVYYASEIDKYAIEITQKNYPNTIQLGDINNIDFTQFKGKIDLIMGGSPCQDLSIAGKRKGLQGERSGLFYKFVEAIEIIKPKYFLLENNYGMPQEAYEEMSKLMGCYPIMINSALVSAQTRKRFYWTNIGPQSFNILGFPTVAMEQPKNKGILLKDVLESSYASDDKSICIQSSIGRATEREYFKENQEQMVAEPICVNSQSGRGDNPNAQPSVQDRIYNIEGKSTGLTTCFLPNIAEPIGVNIPETVTVRKYEVDTEKLKIMTNRIYSVHNKYVTLKVNAGGGGAKTVLYKIDLPDGDYLIRKLTPLEAERLQTLPDNYTAGVSNTQRYKAIGNGWTVDVIAHIFKHLQISECEATNER